MALFKKRVAPGDGAPLVRNRCWADPALDGLVDTLEDRTSESSARVAAALAFLAARRDDPEAFVQVMDAAADRLTDAVDAVRSASAAAGGADPAGQADVRALLAATLAHRAWEVRGAGRASTVGEDAFTTFHTILEEADDVGWSALDVDPGHAGAAYSRLVSGRGLGLPEAEWWHRFEVARRAKPTHFAAHCQMLQALCKKWYGSHEVMFDFARKAAAEAPVGDPIGAVLALAHAEYLVEEGKAAVPDADLALAAAASDRWVSGGEAALAHPRALEAHQWFGWLLRADPQRRWFHLSRVQGRLSWAPWDYLKDGEQVFRTLVAKGDKK